MNFCLSHRLIRGILDDNLNRLYLLGLNNLNISVQSAGIL